MTDSEFKKAKKWWDEVRRSKFESKKPVGLDVGVDLDSDSDQDEIEITELFNDSIL